MFDRRHTHRPRRCPREGRPPGLGAGQKPGGFRYWNGIVPPPESYPQRISLWITCGPAVSSGGQPILCVGRKPNAGKAFRKAHQAAQGAGDNSPQGGLLAFAARYPQSARVDRRGKYRLNGGFCDARQGSARLFASDAAAESNPLRMIRRGPQLWPAMPVTPRPEQHSARRSAWAISPTESTPGWTGRP